MAGKHEGGRDAVTLLATTLVMLLGVLVCSFMILVFSNRPVKPAAILAGGIGGTILLVWLLRAKPRNQSLEGSAFWFWQRGSPPEPEYRPVRQRVIEYTESEYGTNSPPSVDEIRELKESVRTWVPARSCETENETRFDI